MNKGSKVISIILGVLILAALLATAYFSVYGKPHDRFTEFYLLGPGGKADDYPSILVVGEVARVIVGVANYEQKEETYRVDIAVPGAATITTGPIILAYQERKEQEISFSFPTAGDDQAVQFRLYKIGQSRLYDQLHLIASVKDRGEDFTEFFVLKYPPRVLQADAITGATAKIVNHEGRPVDYQLEVWVGTDKRQVYAPITVKDGETTQIDVSFSARVRGIYRANFILRENNVPRIIKQTDCEIEVR